MPRHTGERVVVEDLSDISRRELLRTLGPAAAVVGVAGCLGGADDNGDETGDLADVQTGGTLHAGMQVGVETLDGRSVTGLQSMQVMYNIYSKLLRWRRVDEELRLTGDLATGWEWESETELVFELNEDARFHNGEPVTASDVAYTFETMYDDPQLTASDLFPTEVAVEAIDEHTVSFDTGEETLAPLESSVGFIVGIVSETADQEGDTATEPVGSGPFEFEEWVDGDHIYLTRFDDYWKEDEEGTQLPYLDRIELQIYPDEATKLSNLEAGQLDWVDLVPRRDVERIRGDDTLVTTSTGPGGFMGMMQFNTTEEPFSDEDFRKAFLHALDWDAILETAYYGVPERANNQPLPPRTGWNYEDIDDPYADQNLELAQEHLEQSSIDPETTTFTNYLSRGIAARRRANEIIQEQVRDHLGVSFEIQIVDGSVVFQRQAENDFGFSLSGFNGMYDPDQLLSVNLIDGAFFNYGNYANDEIQTLLQEARQTRDEEQRHENYRQVYEINNEEAGKYYPYWDDIVYAQQPTVHNWVPKLSQLWILENVWKEQ